MTVQSLEEKAAAIASVVWLLEDHYTAVKAGRIGSTIQYERTPDTEGRTWRPPVIEEFAGLDVGEVRRFLARQRYLSKRYRLWPVGLALQKLEREHPEQSGAVKAQCGEFPPPNWYEPERVDDRCREGLRFMAADIPGDVPFFQEQVVAGPPMSKVARNRRILEMAGDGLSKTRIARELGCSRTTVCAVLSGLKVRHGRTASAAS